MAGISRYERAVLGLTVAFLLFVGGWFLGRQNAAAPYEVTTAQNAAAEEPKREESASASASAPDSLLEGEVINLNAADEYTLRRLPGIGEKRAQAIVAYREEYGPFQSLEELDNVEGIGPGILEELRAYVCVTDSGS